MSRLPRRTPPESPRASRAAVRRRRGRARPRRRRRPRLLAAGVLAGLLAVLAGAAFLEMRTSSLQARYFSTLGGRLGHDLGPGPSPVPHFPDPAPYDTQLGYARLPDFLERLRAAGYRIDGQARLSRWSERLVGWGLFPIYPEKTQAGLEVVDREGRPLHGARFPERVYGRFEDVPPLVVETLLFIENRELLDADHPRRNPAVEWARLGKALFLRALGLVGYDAEVIGGSTLATQLEKFRHSPEGRTDSAREKLRQMLSASLRAYRDGPDTLGARRQIVVDYLNSMPLGAAPGFGEVRGLGDGLAAWYGVDVAEANRLLADPQAPLETRALAYKQALSLILAVRRPSRLLAEDRGTLADLADSYLRIMARAGVIDGGLRDAALAERLEFQPPPPGAPPAFAERKGANLVRARLAALLGVQTLYELDRLDLTVGSTLDAPVQQAVTGVLEAMRDAAAVEAAGLKGFRLLERGDPARVILSFTLYERGTGVNRVRVHADNLEQPLDINAGARLDLGSTAKLRALATYLEGVASLHARYAALGPEDLRAVAVHPRDRLTAWGVEHLARSADRSLDAMLEAALARRYPASPQQSFFTGGGLHTFANFKSEDDARVFSVREAFRHSVNLVFIRLMRDVVDHHLFQPPGSLARVLEDPADPRRDAYLTRFADREGSEFIRGFYRKYQGRTPEQALDLLLNSTRLTPHRLAAILRSVRPEAAVDELQALLARRLPGTTLSDRAVAELYRAYAPAHFSLMDRGYIARVHPLELWVLHHLHGRPEASLSDVLGASAGERQEVYRWLFRTRSRNAQDTRIAGLLELEAFLEIQRHWQRLGYPFASLTPSLASAIGSSGDRPAALAELMGIIVNGGMRYPTGLVEALHFGAGTPYETRLSRADGLGQRVMTPEVAAALRGVLVDVVERGTARALPALLGGPGRPHVLGGKTGTGDHRYETYGAGGRLIESKVVNRAATFVFLIDDRFFGTVTAYVPGQQAALYQFTSALPVRLLAILMPVLAPLIDEPPPGAPRAAPKPPSRVPLAAAAVR